MPRNLGFERQLDPDSAHSTGVVGSVVSLTIFAVVGLFYMRHLRQQKAQQQVQEPPPWMRLYVSLSGDAEFENQS